MNCWPKGSARGSARCRSSPEGSTWPPWPRCAAAGTSRPGWTWFDLLAGKSLVVAEPAAGGSRYRLLETIRQYAAGRLAEAGEAGQARDRHAAAFLRLAEQERTLPVLLREHDNFRAALDHTLAVGNPAGPRLARALGRFWLARGFFQEGQGWLERALATGPADRRLRAGLLRLLGTVLYAAGDFQQARATLGQAREAAEAAGAMSVQARIRVQLAEIHAIQDGMLAEALQWCEAAIPRLEAGGDLDGMADAWLLVSKMRLWSGDDPVGTKQAVERAAACARRSANFRAEQESAKLLVYHLFDLPVPADEAVSRAESLLQAASGDSWTEAEILVPLSLLYSYVGRFADARAALAQIQSVFAGAGAKFNMALTSIQACGIELIAGDPAAAEQGLTAGYEALRAMGERGWRPGAATILAEAVYAQGRLDQALRLTEEAEEFAASGDFDAQARWRATRAKVLARRGQFRAAKQLAEEAVALVPAASSAPELAEFLVAQAEVLQLAGALDQAEASLRKALQLYENRRMTALAGQTRTLLASLTGQRSALRP